MRIKPFAALRPAPERVKAVAAVPYDVVDTTEARALALNNPDSFLHVTRPEIDLPDDTDIHSDAVYAQAAHALRGLLERGVLREDSSEHIYLYRQIMGSTSQTSVVVCCHIDDYANNIIRRHEKTRQDKEDDRTRHCMELMANAGPVFLTFRDTPLLTRMISAGENGQPLYDFVADDSVRHTVWRVEDAAQKWVDAFREVPLAYVADGHHRAAAAFRTGERLRQAHTNHTGREEYNWFLAALFPASTLQIMPYNRVVADLNGMTPKVFMERVSDIFKIEPARDGIPAGPREVRMLLGDAWHTLAWEPFEADPVGILDVSVLQNRLLAPLLGIEDPRTSTRISFIGGIRGTSELERLVRDNQAAVAFSMYPVTTPQMMDIADADQVMPPKSTWFEPKLRSGLLIHTFS